MTESKYNRFTTTVNLLLTMGVSMVFFSCGDKACDQIEEYNSTPIDIQVHRLEEEVLDVKNVDGMVAVLNDNRVMADFFLDANQYPNDTILAKRMLRLFQQPSIDTLVVASLAYFSELEKNMEDLGRAYQFVKYHYPEAKIPRVQTMITGLYNDLYVSDSIIVFGIDYFMGERSPYPINSIPKYMVRRYQKESLVPIIMSFVSNEYNEIDRKHGTLLSDMVNIGKSYYFVSQSMPCTPDSLIIGYSAEEMRLVRENQEVIWANLIENELLYETDHFMKNKFIGESPNVVEISEQCPGRVGAWIGWEIVKKYVDKNDVAIKELMAETDAHKIFQLSGYKPRNQKK